MKFVLMPSLQRMTLVKIVISLWNQDDVRTLISNLSIGILYSKKKWNTIEERVIVKVSHLSLPQLLKEKLIGFIKPIGLQIRGWMQFNYTRFDLPPHLPAGFCWTSQGTVDRKKTAELLVKDENLNISTRYKLACIYCLEDYILDLWNKMPAILKESDWDQFPVINFWSRYMKRMRLDNAHIDYKEEFCQSVYCDNKDAAEYFLQKLTRHERKASLVKAAKDVADADVLFFLLTEMNEKQQMLVFKYNPYGVLRCFLQWPFQSFFIGVANCVWDFLPDWKYHRILTDITDKVIDGYKDCDYQKLFREFWQQSPVALKHLIINQIHKGWLLRSLFDIKDKENIRLILKDTMSTVKEEIIYNGTIDNFFQSLIYYNEWDFLEFCIREYFPSINDMLKFKGEFEKRIKHSYTRNQFLTIIPKLDQIFCLAVDSISKRNVEECQSSPSKSFCSLQ